MRIVKILVGAFLQSVSNNVRLLLQQKYLNILDLLIFTNSVVTHYSIKIRNLEKYRHQQFLERERDC